MTLAGFGLRAFAAKTIRVACCVVLLSGCAARTIGPPPAAPTLRRPSDAIPADLDLVLRIDWSTLKATLGTDLIGKLQALLTQGFEAPVRDLVRDALGRSERMWLGLRPTMASDELDFVAVLQGGFERLDPRAYAGEGAWGPASDLGADYRVFDRVTSRRNEPARVYLHGNSDLILATTAELDSVEKQLDAVSSIRMLGPPEQGALAFALQLTWLRSRWQTQVPQLSDVFVGADKLTGFLGIAPAQLNFSAEVECDDAATATQVASAIGLLVREIGRNKPENSPLLDGLQIKAENERVKIQLILSAALSQKWIACTKKLQWDDCGMEQ